MKTAAPMIIDGRRKWIEFQDYDLDASEFEQIGNDFENQREIMKGIFGDANTKLMRQKEIVDFGVEWMNNKEWVRNKITFRREVIFRGCQGA